MCIEPRSHLVVIGFSLEPEAISSIHQKFLDPIAGQVSALNRLIKLNNMLVGIRQQGAIGAEIKRHDSRSQKGLNPLSFRSF